MALSPIVKLPGGGVINLNGAPKWRGPLSLGSGGGGGGAGSGTKSLSINLSGVEGYHPPRFLNRAKQFRAWADSTWATLASPYVDAQGNLVSLPGGVTTVNLVFHDLSHSSYVGQSAIYGGRYRLWWDGEATIGAGLTNRVDLSANSLECDLTFENLTYIPVTPTNPANMPRNFRCVRTTEIAAYEAGQIIATEQLAYLADVGCFRFMDWMWTNWNSTSPTPITEWSEYPTTTNHNWRRVPFAVMVSLCNTVMADGWFCIPHRASDDFIYQMAVYLRDNMDPSLKIRIEYSNEVWNGGFFQLNEIAGWAQAEWGYAGAATGTGQWLSWAGKRLYEAAQIFNSVFAGQTSRLIFVAGGFNTNSGWSNLFATAQHWQTYDPANYVNPAVATFHEIAVNPYFGVGLASDWDAEIQAALGVSQAAAVTEIESHIAQYVTEALTNAASNVTVANSLGLQLCIYEYNQHMDAQAAAIGGSTLTSGGNWVTGMQAVMDLVCTGSTVIAAQNQIRDYFKANNASVLCFFNDAQKWDQFGQWGAEEYPGQNNPVWLALKAWHAANPKWW